jgi:hypothetical protein
VSIVRDALDEVAAMVEPEVEIAALDVSWFCNASGGEAGLLTLVSAGHSMPDAARHGAGRGRSCPRREGAPSARGAAH